MTTDEQTMILNWLGDMAEAIDYLNRQFARSDLGRAIYDECFEDVESIHFQMSATAHAARTLSAKITAGQ